MNVLNSYNNEMCPGLCKQAGANLEFGILDTKNTLSSRVTE